LFFRLNSFELLLFNLAFIKPGQMHVITNKINLAVKKILK
jgi:hypothetical protein